MRLTVSKKVLVAISLSLFYAVALSVTMLVFCVADDYVEIKRMASEAKLTNMKTGECFSPERMFFGGTVCVERDTENKGSFVAYRVSNARYSRVTVDLNKSKIIGEYIGSKSAQLMKGFASGGKKKGKHDDNCY